MKPALNLQLPRLVSVIFLTLFAGWCRGDEPPRADFFDVVGTSPAEVVAMIPYRASPDFMDMDVVLGGFVGLPMSNDHRKEFMEALRKSLETDPTRRPFVRRCLLNLLEEDRSFTEALAVERLIPRTGGNPATAREIALLWKAGKQEEAAKLAGGMKTFGDSDAWQSLVRVDMARNHPEEAMRLLGFLEQLPNLPGNLRYELAIQHLEIARRTGKTAELFAGSPPPVLRAIWHWALGHEQEARDAALDAGPGPSVSDIQALSRALGTNSPAGAYAKAALARPDLARDSRRVLLGLFQNPRERLAVWLEMPVDQGETTDLVAPLPFENELKEIPDAGRRVMEIVKAHPEDARLKLFAAAPQFSTPAEARQLLLEAAKSVREISAADASRYPDPAMSALEQLLKSSEPAELARALSESADFAKLSPEAQLRYLMAAELDQEVVKTMARCHFDQPLAGSAGLDLLGYFSRRAYSRQVPPEVVATLLERLPELVLGSGVERRHAFSQEMGNILTFFSTQAVAEHVLADAIQRLFAAAAGRDPAISRNIVSSLPASIRSLPGLEIPQIEKPLPSANLFSPPKVLQGLSVFSPPDVTVIGRTRYTSFRDLPPITGSSRVSHDIHIVSQFAFSPWTQNYRGAASAQGEEPVVMARLRGLFDKDPSRTLVYDLLVATGKLPCPDPVVKTLVEARIADISHPLPIDPAAGVSLFLHKLSKGESADSSAAVLEGYDRYLLPVRERVLETLTGSMAFRIKPADLDVLRKQLGFPKKSDEQAKQPVSPEPKSAYDRLQFFREAGKRDAPEAIALARDVLFKSVGSKYAETSLDENIAISTLVAAGKFAAFLTDLKSRMEGEGKSELEIQRALYRVHLYRIVHSKGEIFPFAKRILELDPTDTAAAADVLAAAAEENDRPLALKAMGTLCRKSPFALARAVAPAKNQGWGDDVPKPGPLSLFPGAEARVVAELMLACPFKPDDSSTYRPDGSVTELLPLYLYFAENDLASLTRIMRWANAFSPGNGRELTEIAEYLVARKRAPEAVSLLADAYFSPPAGIAGSDLRFAPKASPGDWEPSLLNVYELGRLEILKPLAEAVTRYAATPQTAKARVMISLAADPTSETWDRIVPPFLAASPAGSRQKLREQLQSLIRYNMPEADALNRRLALEYHAADKSPPTLDKLYSKIKLAAESGDLGNVAADWGAMSGLLAVAKPDERTRFLSLLAWPMARISADPEWKIFIKEARGCVGFTKSWLRETMGKTPMNTFSPLRLQDLAEIALSNIEPDDENSYRILELFSTIATSESPDLGVLQKFRPWIEFSAKRGNGLQAPARLQYLDLLAGDASAISPQVDAVFTGESWQVSWTLAGCRSSRSGYPFVRKFPFLDGLFDLEILAGTHGDRLNTVHTVPVAAATGRVEVKLPPGSRFVSLLARRRDGGIVRWSNPLEIGEPVVRTGIALPAVLERLPSAGPFFLDEAVCLAPTPGSDIHLADLPWSVGARTPQLSGWIQGADVTRLYLSFRNADDVELDAKPLQLNAPDPCGLPIWEKFSTTSDLVVPAETEKVALVVKTTRSHSADRILLSDVRLASTSVPDLPPGLVLRGRVPGMFGSLVMDRKENRFATYSRQGIGVFDLNSGHFSGWISVGDLAENEGVKWLDLAGNRIAFATRNGDLHLLSLAERKARKIGRIDGVENFRNARDTLSFSPDGRFLAWGGIMAGLHLIGLDNAGEPAQRLIETGQIQSIDFDADSKVLVARDGTNLITMPLADWQRVVAKVSRAPLQDREEQPTRLFSAGDSQINDKRHGIWISTDHNRKLAQVAVEERYARFPEGVLAFDRQQVPFFVDGYGRILRIDVDRLKGYKPLPDR